MDHIPYPVSTSVPPVHIPLLGLDTVRGSGVPYTGLEKAEDPDGIPTEAKCTTSGDHIVGIAAEANFDSLSDWTLNYWDYPQKQGWVVDDSSSWWTSNAEEDARRAQEWMYFELLHVFLGQPVDPSSLARKEEGSEKILLDSSVVPELLTHWLARQHPSQQDKQDYIGTITEGPRKESRVLSLLARVALECNKLDDLPEPSQSTALAIRVLVETLTNAIYNLACVEATETRDIRKLENNSLLKQRFLSNGWCPFQVARLWGQYSPSTTYYLSSLPREPTFGGVTHNECNERQCKTTSIDPSTYKPQHAESCSTHDSLCPMVGVKSWEVADCIKRGRIPLVRFEESPDGIIRPKIVESRSGLRYVALSHVWSGGLGNVNTNSMFCCQIRRLYNLLTTLRDEGDDDYDRNLGTRKFPDAFRELRKNLGTPLPEPPVLLWMDTLCIPVGKEYEKMKDSAIAQMAQIYVEAQCVLVVDPELQKMKHKGHPEEQIFASVLCSAWNSRSWTFQEACMARVFYVQFLDGHCVVDEKWHNFMKRIDDTKHADMIDSGLAEQVFDMHAVLMAEVSDWFRTMPVMTKIRGYDNRTLMSRSEDWQNFVRVWNGLRRRSTTKIDDLYGIIAIMVDLSAYEILRLPPKERMKAILRSQRTLPISLLYQNCDKLSDLNGKPLWAPSGIAGDPLEMDGGYMCVEENGMLISSQKPDTARHIWPDAYIFSIEGTLPTSFTIRLAQLDLTVSVELCQATSVQIDESTNSWIVLCKGAFTSNQNMHKASGVLLSVRTSGEFTIDTEYVCPLTVCLESQADGDCLGGSVNRKTVQSLEAKALALNEVSIEVHTGQSRLSSKPGHRYSEIVQD
ncbi:MAG: hypothetical protein Q9221_007133 [Calogaya cf. arnoldii]